jgi:hypothetical protein
VARARPHRTLHDDHRLISVDARGYGRFEAPTVAEQQFNAAGRRL